MHTATTRPTSKKEIPRGNRAKKLQILEQKFSKTNISDFQIIKVLEEGPNGVVFLSEVNSDVITLKMILNLNQQSMKSSTLYNEFRLLDKKLNEQGKKVQRMLSQFTAQPTQAMMSLLDASIRDMLFTKNRLTGKLTLAKTQFYVLEHHPNNLHAHLQLLESKLSAEKLVKYSKQIFQCFTYLYNKRVIHLLTKLENLLYSAEDDEIILCDFTESLVTDKNFLLPRGELKGRNLTFTAPEIQNQMETKKDFEKIDFSKEYSWEVGCLLYEISFGCPPFENYPLLYGSPPRVTVPPVSFEGNILALNKAFLALIGNMLINDPSQRISFESAVAEINKIIAANEVPVAPFASAPALSSSPFPSLASPSPSSKITQKQPSAQPITLEAQRAVRNCQLGFQYLSDPKVKDEREAVKYLRLAALEKNDVAQNQLGVCYVHGIGVDIDEKEAVQWFRVASDQGNVSAQYNLGFCYHYAFGIEKNETEAAKWYKLAAEQGYPSAQNRLGAFYLTGTGIEKNEAEAVILFRLAANQGDALAQNNLGYCYQNGQGVEKDEKEAIKWITMAANQGEITARNNLALCYLEGKGVAKDEKAAVKLLRLCAKDQDADSQFFLGNCYLTGRGVEKDEKEGWKWIHRSADLGNKEAQVLLALKSLAKRGKLLVFVVVVIVFLCYLII